MNFQRVWLVLEFNSACKALLEKFEDFILSGFLFYLLILLSFFFISVYPKKKKKSLHSVLFCDMMNFCAF